MCAVVDKVSINVYINTIISITMPAKTNIIISITMPAKTTANVNMMV